MKTVIHALRLLLLLLLVTGIAACSTRRGGSGGGGDDDDSADDDDATSDDDDVVDDDDATSDDDDATSDDDDATSDDDDATPDDDDDTPEPVCESASTVSCGGVVVSSTSSVTSQDAWGSYSCNGFNYAGSEVVYVFTSEGSGDYTFALTGMTNDADVLVLDACDATECRAGSILRSWAEDELTVALSAFTTYYVVVDGYAGGNTGFTLSVDCGCPDSDGDGVCDADDECVGDDNWGDYDGDGYCSDLDCDDYEYGTWPGATEVCDGEDNDCDGFVGFNEQDGDFDGWSACEGDCNDASAASYPGAPETCEDGIDQDCDGSDDPCSGGNCGDGWLDTDEEVDPPVSQFSTLTVNPTTCRYDLSSVSQLYCNGTCTWDVGSDCGQGDADIFCQLRTDNPFAVATSYNIVSAMAAPGFPCARSNYGDPFAADLTDRVSGTLMFPIAYQDSSLSTDHGSGDVVTGVICSP